MPHVAINSTTGPASVFYTISTPNCASAESIDETLPTIVFIHPVYIAQCIFQSQFSDPQLRRFNLIAIDSRGHGETLGPVSSSWGQVGAAEDLINFMEALKLPPCHLLGVSMGACTSLQAAILYPEKIISVTLVSPLPVQEPREVVEGRQEIYDCWVEGFKNPEKVDELALLDAFHGALQLGFNNIESNLIKAINAVTFPQAMKNFAPGKFDEFYTTSVKYFSQRTKHTKSSYSKIKGPVQLLHCMGDIAYGLEFVEELQRSMVDAGVEVGFHQIEDAPHFGHVTHPKEINKFIHDFIIKQTKSVVPQAPDCVISPFETKLSEAGWEVSDDPLANSDDEDEDDFI